MSLLELFPCLFAQAEDYGQDKGTKHETVLEPVPVRTVVNCGSERLTPELTLMLLIVACQRSISITS